MFDKYISQNIKLYHDKTYQYHIKRSKYVMKLSREFARKGDNDSKRIKMSKYLFKVRLYTKLIEIVQQHCLDEIMITKHALLLKIDTYHNAGNLFSDKDIIYDPNMFDESIERFKHLMMTDEESINNKLMKVYEGVDEENLNQNNRSHMVRTIYEDSMDDLQSIYPLFYRIQLFKKRMCKKREK